jgi:hypothetical protein
MSLLGNDNKGLERLWGHIVARFKSMEKNIKQSDLAQTDKNAIDYIKNKPTSEDIVELFVKMDVVQPAADEEGYVYTDNDGKLFIL